MSRDRRAPEPRRLALWALLAWLACAVVMLWLFRANYADLSFRDPDDAMRLAQVRDWIGGQSFQDVSQHRVNPPAGGPMHWSRIVDMPVAGLILLLRPLLGAGAAELVACLAVPLLLLGGLVACVFVAARRMAGAREALIAVALLLTGPSILVQFTPLRIDHHGWQIVLATLALAGAMDRRARRGGIIAGLALATWLQISSEALPYAALFGAVFGVRHWIARDQAARFIGFAGALGGAALPMLAALRGPGAAITSHCDALSAVYVWPLAAFAAATLIAARWRGIESATDRFWIAAIGGGAALLVFALTGGPCLTGDPFAALGPTAYRLWYLQVMEGRPIWEQSVSMWGVILLPPLAGLVASIAAARSVQGEARMRWLALALLIAGAAAVACLVMRALSLAHVFALPALAWAILTLFRRVQASWSMPVRVLGSVALVLLTPAGLCGAWIAMAAPSEPAKPAGPGCKTPESFALLRSLPPTTLFAPIDLGPDILVQTRHRVIATAHHRNAAGITAVIEGFVQPPERARGVITRTSAAYLLGCDSLSEVAAYQRAYPRGLAAMLAKGRVPAWLEPLPGTGPLRLYRIRPE